MVIILWLLGCAVVAALIWAQFRGYDMLDGAYYFTVYHDPADNPDTHTHDQLFARPVWLLCSQDIARFRLVCLAVATVACAMFWWSLRRGILLAFESKSETWWPMWFCVMAGMTWVPVALTYNSLATLFGLLNLAALSAVAGQDAPPSHRQTALALFIAAIATAASFVAKAPAAVALVLSGVFLLTMNPALGTARRRAALASAAGALLAAAFVFVIYLLFWTGQQTDHSIRFAGLVIRADWIGDSFHRYWRELRDFLPLVASDFAWTAFPVAAAVVIFLGNAPNDTRPTLASAALSVVLAAAIVAILRHGLWDASFAHIVSGRVSRFFLLFWGSLLPVLLALWWRASTDGKRTVGGWDWIAVLAVLPFVSSLGSTNTVYVSALHAMVLWSVGLLIVADRIAQLAHLPWFRTAMALCISLGSISHILSAHFWKPYMFQTPLWTQTEAVEIGDPASRLRIDPDLASFLNRVRTTMQAAGYTTGEDVFGFFNLPGVTFAIGAKEPGAPWYFGTWYHGDDTDGAKLRNVPSERRRRAWIITQADVIQFRKQFLDSGIDFPDGYQKIGQTVNPTTGLEIGIWKPLARH